MENLEIAEIKQAIMKLEFQRKKDNAEADRRFNERFDRMQRRSEEMQRQSEEIQPHLNHIN